jgi:hypothetical protein
MGIVMVYELSPLSVPPVTLCELNSIYSMPGQVPALFDFKYADIPLEREVVVVILKVA